MNNIVQIATGYEFSIAKTQNEIYVFGHNDQGQLGIGNTIDQYSPVLVQSISSYSTQKVIAGNYHTIAMMPITFCFGIEQYDTSVCSSNGNCIAADTCSCNRGYLGIQCNLEYNTTCAGLKPIDPNVCSGVGNCVQNNNCTCPFGYSGNNCQYFTCYGINATNQSVCSGNGNCISYNNCSCIFGYLQDQCQLNFNNSCFGIDKKNTSACSGSGICHGFNNCSCFMGYSGSQCQNVSCFGIDSKNPTVCSGRGTCSSYNNCQCNTSFTGSECQNLFYPTCYGKLSNDSTVCSGRGNCVSNNVCVCQTSYFGNQCQSRTNFTYYETILYSDQNCIGSQTTVTYDILGQCSPYNGNFYYKSCNGNNVVLYTCSDSNCLNCQTGLYANTGCTSNSYTSTLVTCNKTSLPTITNGFYLETHQSTSCSDPIQGYEVYTNNYCRGSYLNSYNQVCTGSAATISEYLGSNCLGLSVDTTYNQGVCNQGKMFNKCIISTASSVGLVVGVIFAIGIFQFF